MFMHNNNNNNAFSKSVYNSVNSSVSIFIVSPFTFFFSCVTITFFDLSIEKYYISPNVLHLAAMVTLLYRIGGPFLSTHCTKEIES